MRIAALVIGALDAAAWLVLAALFFFSENDAATAALSYAAGIAVSALFLLTGAPALFLAIRARARRTALALALAFPVLLALLVALVVALLP